MHPFVKWAGGKGQLLDRILPLLPKEFGRYYEPFVGGGAVLFSLAPSKFTVNDHNTELVSVYRCLQKPDLTEKLMSELRRLEEAHSEEHFYEVRGMDRLPGFGGLPVWVRAVRMVYLNKACFNGRYRVNSKGFFNVPSGKKEKVVCADERNLKEIAEYFQKSDMKLLNGDWSKAVEDAEAGDFVYFDPPYDVWEGKGSFTAYTEGGFGRTEQVRLAECIRDLTERGVKVMLSNHNTEFIRTLYEGYDIHTVDARRSINSKADGRGAVEEVLILNYQL